MPKVAKVAIDSPLWQLDRLFDYEIPQELEQSVTPGVRVTVPFGRAKKSTAGFCVAVVSESEFDQISQVESVVSKTPVLQPQIYELCRAVADRQACSLFDVLKLAVPSRSVKVEEQWQEREAAHPYKGSQVHFDGEVEITDDRVAFTPVPNYIQSHPGWVWQFLKIAEANLSDGKSTIIVVPDQRDQIAIFRLLNSLTLKKCAIHYQGGTPSARYSAFLGSIDEPKIIVGSRAAIFAPAHNLASILLFNDADPSLFEPTSPYLATREIALIRAQLQSCQIILASHSRSAEVQRLVEMNYLVERQASFAKPKVAVTQSESRIDSLAHHTIRKALDAGESALVQVASAGTTTGLFCQQCSSKFHCKNCNGPVGLNSQNKPKCRWCGAFNLDLACSSCGGHSYRQGRAGVSRTATEIGKIFAGIAVIEASGEKPIFELPPGKRIVVATIGAEPLIDGGYGATILLDAAHLLAREGLKATETTVRQWADAVSSMKPGAQAVLVGLPNTLGQQFALWNLTAIARQELAERRELKFPPQVRLASLSAEKSIAQQLTNNLANISGKHYLEVLGPIEVAGDARYLIRYDYAIGAQLAVELKQRIISASAGLTRVGKSGRNSRAVKLKMDDAEVI